MPDTDPTREALGKAAYDATVRYNAWHHGHGVAEYESWEKLSAVKRGWFVAGAVAAVGADPLRAAAVRYIAAWEAVERGVNDWDLHHAQVEELRAAQAAYRALSDPAQHSAEADVS